MGKSRNSHGGTRAQRRSTCCQASSRSPAVCAPLSTAVAADDAFGDAVADYRTFCGTTIAPASLTFSPRTRKRRGDSR